MQFNKIVQKHLKNHYCCCIIILKFVRKECFGMSNLLNSGSISQVTYGRIFIDIDDKFRIVSGSRGFFELTGYTNEDIRNGLTLEHLFQDKDSALKFYKAVMRNLEKINERLLSHTIFNKDGVKIFVESYATLEYDSHNGHNIINLMISDVSEHRRLDAQIKMQNTRYKIIEENTDEIYFDYDVKTDIIHLPKKHFSSVSKKFNLVKYWSSDSPRQTVHPDDYEMYKREWEKCLASSGTSVLEFRTRAFSSDGSYQWFRLPLYRIADDDGKVVSIFGRMYPLAREKELSEKISTDQQVIHKLSTTDQLTGLYNRNTFKKLAKKKLEEFDETKCYAVIYSDINDFSYINDNFGYDEGNSVLCDFARLVEGQNEDTVSCRIYSDYYLTFIIAKSQDEIINAVSYVNDIFTSKQKEKYPASDIHISSGIYFFSKNGKRDITIAIDNANLARRSVKGSKDVPCGIYSETLRRKRSHDQTIASELHAAIENGFIEAFLQPKFSLKTREITGAEALARWKNQDGTYKLPFEFIDVLEKVGYITELDYHIYETVLKRMQQWKKDGKQLYPISINFSRLHMMKNDFVENIIRLADQYDIEKNLIEIEVTESAFALDAKAMVNNLTKLKDAGFKIDIDDFGIGYSSLSMLMTAPIDTVKVDKLFIDNIVNSELEREYVKQICILISTTKKNVVFEGVETEEQANFISKWGFNIAQGWLFDKALALDEFEKKYL